MNKIFPQICQNICKLKCIYPSNMASVFINGIEIYFSEEDLNEGFADFVKRKIRIYWDCFKYINFQIYRLFIFKLNR
jgi:hypothetical protein